jgi:hypothetical protein
MRRISQDYGSSEVVKIRRTAMCKDHSKLEGLALEQFNICPLPLGLDDNQYIDALALQSLLLMTY